jgi:hypothetical protein
VRQPVRPRNQYRLLLRSIDVPFDFSVSLDYSLTSQSARSLQVPRSNRKSSSSKPDRNAGIFRVAEQAGHEVVTVNDGAEAVRIAVRNSFDAILMDVHMPEMDGYAATRAIRNAMQDAPPLPIT